MKTKCYIEEFLKDGKVSANLAGSSVVNYKIVLSKFSDWFKQTNDELFTPENITSLDVKDYRGYLKRLDRSPKTINRAIAVIKKFCTWAVDNKLIETDPALCISGIGQAQLAPQWLKKKEQFALIRELDKAINNSNSVLAYRNKAIIILMLHAGLRVSEVCNIAKTDTEIGERKGQVIIRESKGKKGRVVPANKEVRKALFDYLGIAKIKGPYLFYSQRSNFITPRAVQHLVEDLGRLAKLNQEGIKKLTPHKLRHSFCHNLLEQGETLDKVAILAGHITKVGLPNIKTTLIYTVPSRKELEKAVSKLEWESTTPWLKPRA